MNQLFVFLCCAVAYVAAQPPPYACSPGYCETNGYVREDEMGCTYFCYLDISNVGSTDCPEFHTRYGQWKGSEPLCDRNCYVTANKAVLPRACDTELEQAFERLSVLDGMPGTISGQDIEQWCQDVKMFQTGQGRIFPPTWKQYWAYLYADISDPNCPTI